MLKAKRVSDADIRAIYSFFSHLFFHERQRMFDVFFGWPEEAPFFAALARKKKEAVESKNMTLLDEVFTEEKEYLDGLARQL